MELAADIKKHLLKDTILGGAQQREYEQIHCHEVIPSYSKFEQGAFLPDQDYFAYIIHKYWDDRSQRWGPSFKIAFVLLAEDLPTIVTRIFLPRTTIYKSPLMDLPRLSVCRFKITLTAKGYPEIHLVDKPAIFTNHLKVLGFSYSQSGDDAHETPLIYDFENMRTFSTECYHF